MLHKFPSWTITNSFLLPTDLLHTGHVCPCKALSVKITRRRSPESRLAAEAEAGTPPTKPAHAVSQAWGAPMGRPHGGQGHESYVSRAQVGPRGLEGKEGK